MTENLRKCYVLALILVICIWAPDTLRAQYLPDGVWMTSKNPAPWDTSRPIPHIYKRATMLHFEGNSTFIDSMIVQVECGIGGYSIINDPEGNIYLYSHGYKIGNRYGELVAGGENLFNIPHNAELEEWTFLHFDYIHPQDCIILPDPKDSLIFHLIHMRHIINFNTSMHEKTEIYHTIVSMNDEERRGAVIQSPLKLSEEALIPGKMTATRHANGRDWWVICRSDVNGDILMFSLNQEGTSLSGRYSTNNRHGHIGDVRFSPDGRKLAQISRNYPKGIPPVYHQLHLMDFDPETGALENEIEIPLPFILRHIISKVEFSLDARKIYFHDYFHLFQVDLEREELNIEVIDVIELYNSRSFGFHLNFGSLKIAPNCKILTTSLAGLVYLHTIEHPDELGFQTLSNQRTLYNPDLFMRDFPNTPHYKLGEELREWCDSLDEHRRAPELVHRVQFRPEPGVPVFDPEMAAMPTHHLPQADTMFHKSQFKDTDE
jgi:hypothetical protein